MEPLTFEEAIAVIRETELLPWSNPNGPDALSCPYCMGNIQVRGDASAEMWRPGHPLQHEETCPIARAWATPIPDKIDHPQAGTF